MVIIEDEDVALSGSVPTEPVVTSLLTEEPTEMPTEQPTEVPAVQTETEHIHTEECYEVVYQCGFEEHIHEISCYSDLSADLEDWDIWAASIPELTGRVSEDIVLVAQSQLGCMESSLNFELAEDGETRNGITRYGQWYGNPYGAWSNMFTSFCLRYAGLTSVPINSGAEAMRIAWEGAKLYRYASNYEPVSGDIVFLDKNQNGTAEATAIVVRYFDFVLTVIEGDVDNAVVQTEYRIDDPEIVGYGMTNPYGSLMFATAASGAAKTIGQSVTYTDKLIKNGDSFILYTAGADGKYYAIDGNAKAVEVQVNATSGAVYSDIEDPSILYWTFGESGKDGSALTFPIQNVATGMYLHPYRDNDQTYGVLHTVGWKTALHASAGGVKFRGVNQSRYAQLSGDAFVITNNEANGSVFYFGKAPSTVTLWLDGTNGNIMSYRGSDNTKYTVYSGVESQLPSQWKSPAKYSYKLAGWVDIKTGDYYLPGDTITITENTVLYADWVASTYDIGKYNSLVADTISTNDFITTYVFDYSSLINLNSTKVDVNVSDSSHSETWTHVGSGNVSYQDQTTLNFSFNDHDSSGMITNPGSRNPANEYTGGTAVRAGIYTDNLKKVLFGTNNLLDPETGEGVVGKHYLGKGDHLFQINTDPTSEYYGYYYYDAKLNAASYNQTDQRFYVYEYLARSSDSANNNDAGKYSDFLPLNSPYANTNGQALKTYNYAGENGEYQNVSHYVYDAKYDSNGSASSQIMANLWFGMRVDVKFALPDKPGSGGNKDIYGKEMHFKFTGDDDVWILIDNELVLDLGGIHQAAEGDINFSTGKVRVNGTEVASTVTQIEPGERTLTILYLERGSSMSNCAIYFNLAPQFSLTLQKEDVLTRELLEGATFAFYEDPECETASTLYTSQQAFKENKSTNEFTIKDGKAYVWGLSPYHTYYIREETPPTYDDGKEHHPNEQYSAAKGVIRLILDKTGLNSSSATILKDNGQEISHGFTIHGFRIDEENQAAYINITNAQNWVEETTSVYVEKKWSDSEDHTYDSVTVYLNAADAKGTVHRIREVTLSEENDWKYAWTNLPKYLLDTENMEESETEIEYSVSEAYIPGYTPQIIVLEDGKTYVHEYWVESVGFENGKQYLIKTPNGFLSAEAADKDTLCYVDEATARTSPLATWTATKSTKLKLTNGVNQSLNYVNSNGKRYFNVVPTSTATTQNLSVNDKEKGRLYYSDRGNYYIGDLSNGYATASTGNVWVFQPMIKNSVSTTVELEGLGYRITNTPLATETSLTVRKQWDNPGGDASLYEKAEVTVKLFANGVDAGRTETISLKSNWMAVFSGLPYMDEEGNPIKYTVKETWQSSDWTPRYGEVIATSDEVPTYEVIVTNVYRWKDAIELPSTGGIGYPIFVLSGLILVLAPLVYGLRLRREHRKGAKK